MYNYKRFIILLISLLMLLPIAFSYHPLTIDIKTQPDISPDRYYVSQNVVRQIYFSIHSDYLSPEVYKPVKVKYRLTIYPEEEITAGTSFKLSKTEESFVSEVNSEIGVDVIARNFTENIVKLKLSADLYDEYNNVIESTSKTLTLITNNSVDDFTYTKQRDEPKFKGIVYSRDVSYLINKNDIDYIKIKSYSDLNYVYDIKCRVDSPSILANTIYAGNNEFDLNISINKEGNIDKGEYMINCYAYNRDNKFDLKTIKLNYLDEPIVIRTDLNVIDTTPTTPKTSFRDKLLKFRLNVKNGTLSLLKGIGNFFK